MAARRSAGGQSLVEMTVVLPLLMLVFCGILECGSTFVGLMRLQSAARVGARVGADGGDAAAVGRAVESIAGPVEVAITVRDRTGRTVSGADRSQYNLITVKVSKRYSTFSGLVDLRTLAGVDEHAASNTFVIRY